MGSNPVRVTKIWEYSSAGRALALQARGHRFEPCCSHHSRLRHVVTTKTVCKKMQTFFIAPFMLADFIVTANLGRFL